MIIILFGPNAVGKSTVGRELAGRMKRAAYVEADLLKYFVAGKYSSVAVTLRIEKTISLRCLRHGAVAADAGSSPNSGNTTTNVIGV